MATDRLAELGPVPGDHKFTAVLGPALLIEPAHLPAQGLGRARMRRRSAAWASPSSRALADIMKCSADG